jgi:hypothetical protein
MGRMLEGTVLETTHIAGIASRQLCTAHTTPQWCLPQGLWLSLTASSSGIVNTTATSSIYWV